MAREHCFYEDIFNYIVHGTYWTGVSDAEKDKLRRESANYSVIHGNLFHAGSSSKKLQQVIVNKSDQQSVISEYHVNEETGDHLNVKNTCSNLRKKYHWKNIDIDVSNFIKSCQECNINKDVDISDTKTYEPALFLDRAWKLVEVDVIGPLIFHEKEIFLLRLTDIFSKWMSYNFLNEINFKDISSILLHEFLIIGFPAGIRLIGIEDSKKLIDTFEVALKDCMDNVEKIKQMLNKCSELSNHNNLIYKENNTQLENEVNVVKIESEMKSCEYIETKTANPSLQIMNCDKDGEIAIEAENSIVNGGKQAVVKNTVEKQGSADCDISSALEIAEINPAVKKMLTDDCGGNTKNYENGWEADNNVQESNKSKVTSETKNYETDIQTEDEAKFGSEIKNCKNDIEMGCEANVTAQPELNSKNDIHMEEKDKAVTTESEVKSCDNSIQIADEMKAIETESEMKSNESDDLSSYETKAGNFSPNAKNYGNNVEIVTETKITTIEQENINCENSPQANVTISLIELETKTLNQEQNKEEASEIQQNVESVQSVHNTDAVTCDTNAIVPVPCQKENVTYKQNIFSSNSIPAVGCITESENTFKELDDFEIFFKSSGTEEKTLLYFFIAQKSLLDSEIQNIRDAYLQEFIKLYPDSWTNNLSYFNFHIRNSLSASSQTPCKLLFHRDLHLLRLYNDRSSSQDNQYLHLQKENFHADQIRKIPYNSSEDKHTFLAVHEGYTMQSLSTSTPVRKHSRYGLRKSPKPNESGFSQQFAKSSKRSFEEDINQKDCSPPLKTRRLSSYQPRRLNSIQQRTIEKILKNYSLKSPVILLTPLPCSVVDNALHGETNALSLEKYIQLSCKNT